VIQQDFFLLNPRNHILLESKLTAVLQAERNVMPSLGIRVDNEEETRKKKKKNLYPPVGMSQI
jgi:hypothetical protein